MTSHIKLIVTVGEPNGNLTDPVLQRASHSTAQSANPPSQAQTEAVIESSPGGASNEWHFLLPQDWEKEIRTSWLSLDLFSQQAGAMEGWTFWLDQRDLPLDASTNDSSVYKIRLAAQNDPGRRESRTSPVLHIQGEDLADLEAIDEALLQHFAETGNIRMPIRKFFLSEAASRLDIEWSMPKPDEKQAQDEKQNSKSPLGAKGGNRAKEFYGVNENSSETKQEDWPRLQMILTGASGDEYSAQKEGPGPFQFNDCSKGAYTLFLEITVVEANEKAFNFLRDKITRWQMSINASINGNWDQGTRYGRILSPEDITQPLRFETNLSLPECKLEWFCLNGGAQECWSLSAPAQRALYSKVQEREHFFYANGILLNKLRNHFTKNGTFFKPTAMEKVTPSGSDVSASSVQNTLPDVNVTMQFDNKPGVNLNLAREQRQLLKHLADAFRDNLNFVTMTLPAQEPGVTQFGDSIDLKYNFHKITTFERIMIIDYGAGAHMAYVAKNPDTTTGDSLHHLPSQGPSRYDVPIMSPSGPSEERAARLRAYSSEILVPPDSDIQAASSNYFDHVTTHWSIQQIEKGKQKAGTGMSDMPGSYQLQECWPYRENEYQYDFLKFSYWHPKSKPIFHRALPDGTMYNAVYNLVWRIFAEHWRHFMPDEPNPRAASQSPVKKQPFQLVVTHPAFASSGERQKFQSLCREVAERVGKEFLKAKYKTPTGSTLGNFVAPVIAIPEPLAAAAALMPPNLTDETRLLIIDIGKMSLDAIVTDVTPGQHANLAKMHVPDWDWKHQFCFGLPFAGMQIDFCLIEAVATLLEQRIAQAKAPKDAITIPGVDPGQPFAKQMLGILPNRFDKMVLDPKTAEDMKRLENGLCPFAGEGKDHKLAERSYRRNLAILRMVELAKIAMTDSGSLDIKLCSHKHDEPCWIAGPAAKALAKAGIAQETSNGDIWVSFTQKEIVETPRMASCLETFGSLVEHILQELGNSNQNVHLIVAGMACAFRPLDDVIQAVMANHKKITTIPILPGRHKQVTAEGAALLARTPRLCVQELPIYLYLRSICKGGECIIENLGTSQEVSQTITLPRELEKIELVAGPPGAASLARMSNNWFTAPETENGMNILFPTHIEARFGCTPDVVANLSDRTITLRTVPDKSGANGTYLCNRLELSLYDKQDKAIVAWDLDNSAISL